MFRIEEIKAVHAKAKTGAEFPAYIRDMKELGVAYYETHLVDGHSYYHGKEGYELASGPKYDAILVSKEINLPQLKKDIACHQQGGSDYFEVSKQCAGNGIEKWAVCMDSMTCTYYDKAGDKILVEQIPA
jgi:uncharacterized protein YbcV (DUF1398 family)